MSAKASLLFSTGHIHEASLVWHDVVRRLHLLVTFDSAACCTMLIQEDPACHTAAPSCFKGAFVVHPSLEIATSEDQTFVVCASAIEYAPSSSS